MEKIVGHFRGGIISAVLLSILFFSSCNKDEEITTPDLKPRITLDSENNVYKTKIGRTFNVNPEVENAENALFYWKLDGHVVGEEKTFSWSFDDIGTYYFTLRVETSYDYAEVQFKVEVGDLAPPAISLAVPTTGLEVIKNREYVFNPEIQNADGASVIWELDDEKVGEGSTYAFIPTDTGEHLLRVTAENEDGSDMKEIMIKVVNSFSVDIVMPPPSRFADPFKKSVSLGRTLYLRPIVNNAAHPRYSWYVNDVLQEGETDRLFLFTPTAEGIYKLRFVVTDEEQAEQGSRISRHITRSGNRVTDITIDVECFGEESTLIKNTTGRADFVEVYEFLPAPGQFVNDQQTAGYGTEKTFEQAQTYAQKRLEEKNFVSLGGFGGYIIVGFDHSVQNLGSHDGYDFSIEGNQLKGSSEPGIVWVMQDTNGNGEPDDTWYELKGSETGKDETVQDYAVTYYRPGGKGMSVQWTDNYNSSGRVDYLRSHHNQDYYYPLWVAEEYYTLYGTCLAGKTAISGGVWHNGSYAWGYADNFGSDMLSNDPNENAGSIKTYFKISNAINLDESQADLQFIDFIKVQTGVNSKSGGLGEISTEVFSFTDENL